MLTIRAIDSRDANLSIAGNLNKFLTLSGKETNPITADTRCSFSIANRIRTLLLNISSQNFLILEINQSARTFTIARIDFLDPSICPKKFSNTTLNFTLFHYTPKDRNTTLLYDCETPKSSTDLSSFQYCSVSSVSLKAFFVPGTDLGSYELAWPVCNLSVVVPVREEAIKEYPVDARKIIEKGFEVEWTSMFEKERKDCIDSGGICRNDDEAGAGNEFMCLCPRDQETSDHGLKLCETSDHEQPPTSRPENSLSGKFKYISFLLTNFIFLVFPWK